jgi:UDP-2,4-diacetamido-2,4,6-trideoxy-beta-L-altropyranose hydrolase
MENFSPNTDWLIVDHYGLDARWEEALRPMAKWLAAIDDLADRPHAVDLLVDSSHFDFEAGRYDALLPSWTRRAIGPDYALLRREFLEQTPPERDHRIVRRILVTFGGNDPPNAAGLALEALDVAAFADIHIDLTLGVSNPRLESLKARAAQMPNVTVYVQSSHIAQLMARADLCLGAGGLTSWERCYMGLPSLVLVLAENQSEIATTLDRLGCILNLGPAQNIDTGTLRKEVSAALLDAKWRRKASLAGRALVDGQGVSRVLRLLQAFRE